MRGRQTRPGTKGAASKFITRKKALFKLQISLKDFRKLCILKGIYPRDPPRKIKGKDKTYYHVKDIQFIQHDPLLPKMREMKTHQKRVRKAKGRGDKDRLKELRKTKPSYRIDHMIKERYPSFADALRDLDDCLSMVHLFASLPRNDKMAGFTVKRCQQLAREWQAYVVRSGSLKKVFITIKGIYYQASVQGHNITWLVPYPYTLRTPKDVDYRVMKTFLEFYTCLLGFVLHRLYSSLGLHYPPKLNYELVKEGLNLTALAMAPSGAEDGEGPTLVDLMAQLGAPDADGPQAEAGPQEAEPDTAAFGLLEEGGSSKPLFAGLKFFLSREVLRDLVFVILSLGGLVGWEGPGSPFDGNDPDITHKIVDRPPRRKKGQKQASRAVVQAVPWDTVQPQWIADSVNAGILLPVHEYAPGVTLPPHLSPFVDDEAAGYVPERRKEILRLVARAKGQQIGEDGQVELDGDDDDGSMSSEELDEAARKLEQEYQQGLKDEMGDDDDEEADDDDDEEEEEEEEDDDDDDDDDPNAHGWTVPDDPVDIRSLSRAERRAIKEAKSKQMASVMLPRKQRRLYNRIQFSKRAKKAEIDKLKAKAAAAKEAEALGLAEETASVVIGGKRSRKAAAVTADHSTKSKSPKARAAKSKKKKPKQQQQQPAAASASGGKQKGKQRKGKGKGKR